MPAAPELPGKAGQGRPGRPPPSRRREGRGCSPYRDARLLDSGAAAAAPPAPVRRRDPLRSCARSSRLRGSRRAEGRGLNFSPSARRRPTAGSGSPSCPPPLAGSGLPSPALRLARGALIAVPAPGCVTSSWPRRLLPSSPSRPGLCGSLKAAAAKCSAGEAGRGRGRAGGGGRRGCVRASDSAREGGREAASHEDATQRQPTGRAGRGAPRLAAASPREGAPAAPRLPSPGARSHSALSPASRPHQRASPALRRRRRSLERGSERGRTRVLAGQPAWPVGRPRAAPLGCLPGPLRRARLAAPEALGPTRALGRQYPGPDPLDVPGTLGNRAHPAQLATGTHKQGKAASQPGDTEISLPLHEHTHTHTHFSPESCKEMP